MQTKKHSHYEVIANQIVGILVGLVVMFFLLPLLKDIPAQYASPIVVFVMFVFSYTRSYLLRRLFNKLMKSYFNKKQSSQSGVIKRKDMFIEKMEGQKYIDKTREYLDYLEKHLNNVAKAFQEVSEACDGMAWVGDDYTWHTLRREVELHDLSKFSKEEFTQYRGKWFSVDAELHDTQLLDMNFDNAFENHKLKNAHHWQSAVVETDIVHMIVDWTAMSYDFGGNAESYYEANKSDIKIKEDWKAFMYEVFERLR